MALKPPHPQKRQDDGGDLGGGESETSSFVTSMVSLNAKTIGYWTTRGTMGTLTCTGDSSFWPDMRLSGDYRTFASCDRGPGWVATSCNGPVVEYYNTDGRSDELSCEAGCITFLIFDYYNGGVGSGVQYMIDCDTLFGSSGGGSITSFYREIPADSTTTEASLTTHDSITADSTNFSTSSATSDPENNVDARGLSSGAIAGIVIGAIGGLCLIGCGFYIAYRMGRRSRDNPERPRRGFIDSLRALPRPHVNITWTHPKGKGQLPVIQQTFTEDVVKGPGEMLGDTSQHDPQPAVAAVQRLPKSEVPVVELPGGRVAEVEAPGDDGVVGARTDQQQPYAVHRANSRPSGI